MLSLLFVVGEGRAEVIGGIDYIQPTIESTTHTPASDGDTYNGSVTSLVDGSGIVLATGFSDTPAKSDGFSTISGGGNNIVFDLGAEYTLTSCHMWSRTYGSLAEPLPTPSFQSGYGGLKKFTISTSLSPDTTGNAFTTPNPNLNGKTVAEDQPPGTTVGTLYTENGEGIEWVYTLEPGYGDNAAFTVDGSNLLTAVFLDYEATNSYDISVVCTTSGVSYTNQDITVTIVDVAEYLMFLGEADVEEDTASPICTMVTHGDTNAVTYSLTGGRYELFQIGSSSGVLTFKDIPANTVGDAYYVVVQAVNTAATTNRAVVKVVVVSESVDGGTIFAFR